MGLMPTRAGMARGATRRYHLGDRCSTRSTPRP